MMSYYKSKPKIIQAFRYGIDDAPLWFLDAMTKGEANTTILSDPPYCEIHTLEGIMRAQVGEYIIKGIKDEIYPCKTDIFESSYEPLGNP